MNFLGLNQPPIFYSVSDNPLPCVVTFSFVIIGLSPGHLQFKYVWETESQFCVANLL